MSTEQGDQGVRDQGVRDQGLGAPGWFGRLVDEAVDREGRLVADARTVRGGAALDAAVRELLWTSGVAVGGALEGPPSPVAGAGAREQAFIELLRLQLHLGAGLVHDLRPGLSRDRHRTLLAGLMAAAAGELATAAALEEASQAAEPLEPRSERRLFGIVGARLVRRAYLLGHPPAGLPVHPGLALLEVRRFVRLASAVLARPGRLRRRAAVHLAQSSRGVVLYLEALAALVHPPGPPSAEVRRTVHRQVRALPLGSADRRAALRAVDAPRALTELLESASARGREALLEPLALAALLRPAEEGLRGSLRGQAVAAGIAPAVVDAALARAAALLLAQADAVGRLVTHVPSGPLQETLASAMEAVQGAADSLAREVQETGELGILLARLAHGETLSAEERRRMRAQLVDLAKAVPSLAVFAAPGGMLLLPVLLKVLPFDLRPSAFQPPPRPTRAPLALPAPAPAVGVEAADEGQSPPEAA